MIRKILIGILLAGTSANAQSLYPGMFETKCKIQDKVVMKVKYFPLQDVRLLPSRFRENMQRDSAWIVSIPVNSMLHSFRNNAGIFTGNEGGYFVTPQMGGWESLDCDLRGHAVGHLLSACALMYAQTGNDLFKMKGDSIVDGLAEVQTTLGNSGYLSAFPENLIDRIIKQQSAWAPWYTLHKILSGLIDQYLYTDNSQALETAQRMSEWAYNKVSSLDSTSLANMIRFEYGGINESFYNMYAITGDKRFYKLASLFYKKDNIEPLKHRTNDLGTLHANTFIPKIIAEARKYELTGEESSKTCSEYFMQLINQEYSFVNGETGDHEHFFAPKEIGKHLTGYDGEGCCTYNMLKLCRHLFCWNADEKLMEYYERALYNHILGQQDPETGMMSYFTPMQSGAFKVYSTPNNSYWCCVGSGFESNAKYGETIYAHDNNGVYINLFIPSTLNWKEQGFAMKQTTDFPVDGNINIEVTAAPKHPFTVYLRYPTWSGKPTVIINGKKIKKNKKSGSYLSVKRIWKEKDYIKISFPMSISTYKNVYINRKTVIKYGPIVLAGDLGDKDIYSPAPYSDPKKYNDYYCYDFNIPSDINTTISLSDIRRMEKKKDSLDFTLPDGRIIKPLFDIHKNRYVVYWDDKDN